MWTSPDQHGPWKICLQAPGLSPDVTDDDGESTQAEIIVLVAEAPAEGIIQSITETLGSTTTAIIGLLAIIIVGLVVFLLFTRQGQAAEDFGMFEQSQFTAETKPWRRCRRTIGNSCSSSPTRYGGCCCTDGDGEPVNTGPPLPATGLPQGWTMEQWNYYGEQWLAANQPARLRFNP